MSATAVGTVVSTLKLVLSATATLTRLALLPAASLMVPPLSVSALAAKLMPLASLSPVTTV